LEAVEGSVGWDDAPEFFSSVASASSKASKGLAAADDFDFFFFFFLLADDVVEVFAYRSNTKAWGRWLLASEPAINIQRELDIIFVLYIQVQRFPARSHPSRHCPGPRRRRADIKGEQQQE